MNVLSLAPVLLGALLPTANPESLALQSTPAVDVFVHAFRGLPSWVLEGAETEAVRLFQPAQIGLRWVDCTPRQAPAICYTPQTSNELVIRFTPNALPSATANALGAAFPSRNGATAFVFYNRVAALQTSTSLLQTMLGRVLAHEIAHLLLPGEKHSEAGLMRGKWGQDDLRFTSMAGLGLPVQSVRFMQREANRRMIASRGPALN